MYVCGSNHPSPAVCLDAEQYVVGHGDCLDRYNVDQDEIIRAVVQELQA